MKKYETILFDLDGTLLDTIKDITNSINITLNKYGFNIIYSTRDVETFIGSGARVLIKRALKKFNVSDDIYEQVHEDYCKHYADNNLNLTTPFENVINVLNELKEKGYKLGIISNKPHEDTIRVVDYYFPNIFNIVTGKMSSFKPKPDNEIFNYITETYGLNKKDCLYIGDMDVDIQFAKNCNIDICVYSNGYGKIKNDIGQTYTFNNFVDILKIVEE